MNTFHPHIVRLLIAYANNPASLAAVVFLERAGIDHACVIAASDCSRRLLRPSGRVAKRSTQMGRKLEVATARGFSRPYKAVFPA